jgi:acetate kinase
VGKNHHLNLVKNCLDADNKELKEMVEKNLLESEDLKTKMNKQEEETQNLRKENRRLKKSINVYELLLKLPNNVKSITESGHHVIHSLPFK